MASLQPKDSAASRTNELDSAEQSAGDGKSARDYFERIELEVDSGFDEGKAKAPRISLDKT